MGVEVFQFGLAEGNPAIVGSANGSLNGEVLQTIGHLIKDLKNGESGQIFIDELESLNGHAYAERKAVADTFRQLQKSPHHLAVVFDGASRGHDHWAFLLELGTEPSQRELAHASVFGSSPVGHSAIGSQGIPIRWSTSKQVHQINEFLEKVDLTLIQNSFSGFPKEQTFYKSRFDDQLESCIQELRELIEFYSLASENQLATITILD